MKRYLLLSVITAGLLLAALMAAVNAQPPARAGVPHQVVAPLAPLETATLYAVADAYIYSANPTQNYGSATDLYVGSQTASTANRALFRFDLSSLPTDAIVDSASFQAYLTLSGTPATLSVSVHRINVDWAESSVNWSNQPPVTSIDKSNGVGTTPQYYGWDVMDLAQTWVENPAANFGLELRSETEGTVGWRGFASREASGYPPRLVIEYHLPSCIDPQEPNDTFAQAFLITPTVEYTGCIPTPSDLDYFRFDVASNTAISVELFNLPANYDLYLYDPAQALLDSSINVGTTSEMVEYTTGPVGGQFYAKVQSGGEWDLYNSYALKLTLTPVTVWPDLAINDLWREGNQVCYEIENLGQATALQGHHTSLYIGSTLVVTDSVDVDLAPSATIQQCFVYQWQCTPPQDTLTVCADHGNDVSESNETNNCTEEIWSCDTSPPVIITGPTVSNITSAGATVSWTTDEDSDSAVQCGRKAGMFEGEETDSALTQAHVVVLTGLEPSATYRYVVSSTDAASNTVASREAFFTTGAVPGSQPPSISDVTLTRMPGELIYYNIAASVPTGADIDRLEFYMDGELLGKAYAPLPDAPPGLFEFPLMPAALNIPREEFFTEHEIEAVAVSRSEQTSRFPVQFDPPYECAEIDSGMRLPDHDITLYIDDSVLPDGTPVRIQVTAKRTEQDCSLCFQGQLPIYECKHCTETDHPVQRVDFAVAGHYLDSLPGNDDHEYIYDWDAGGLGPGVYEIRVDAIVNDDCKETLLRDVTVVRGEPELEVTRQVTRHGNYFEVALTVENRGHASLVVDRIEDYLTGFQPITKTNDVPPYEVTADCRSLDATCDVAIDVSGDVGGWAETLEPDESLILSYLVVPVLYPEADDVDHAIGDEPVIVHVFAEPSEQSFDRPCVSVADGALLAHAVISATAESDYLIVTHPFFLYSLFNNDDTDRLLAAMAELAQLKNSVLGYLTGLDFDTADAVREQIWDWGENMRGSDGIDGHYLTNGYLLIVGEVEVVPSFTTRFENDSNPDQTVHFTDLKYGNTGGHFANPELSVGRIIGNEAAELLVPLRASINVTKGEPGFEFDRSSALVVAGGGSYVSDFEDGVDELSGILDTEFPVVDVLKQREEEGAGHIMNSVFEAAVPDQDVVHYFDHCGRTRWGDGSTVVSAGDLQNGDVDFGNASPFIFACCCLSGRYERYELEGDASIAEEFLHHGAVNYIGAVEIAYLSAAEEECPGFYERWVGTTKSVGRALRDLKRDMDGYMEDMWAAQFNLYGDPKYGGSDDVVTAAAAMEILATPPHSYSLTIPDYQVRRVEDQDHVRIPGGGLMLRLGQPAVPDYVADLVIPSGYPVQDVILVERSGLVTDMGLHIPIVTTATLALAAGEEVEVAALEGAGWWPEETFTWSVERLPDGMSVLTIRMYPFYYNASTTDVRFYKNYDFDIRTIASTVAIGALTTDKYAYAQGEVVTVGLWITSTGAAQDVVVSVAVESESSGEIVDGLLLRTLPDVESLASFSSQWNSAGFAPGYYTIQAELRNTNGDVLAREEKSFRVGIASGEITTFTVSPGPFEIGEQVAVSLTFANTGTVPLTGTAVVQIQDQVAGLVEEFSHDYGNLPPGNSASFTDVWDTSGAAIGSYRVVAYVLYESTATEPSVAIVRIGRSIYLPLILKRFG
jgi:hypothetical protein